MYVGSREICLGRGWEHVEPTPGHKHNTSGKLLCDSLHKEVAMQTEQLSTKCIDPETASMSTELSSQCLRRSIRTCIYVHSLYQGLYVFYVLRTADLHSHNDARKKSSEQTCR